MATTSEWTGWVETTTDQDPALAPTSAWTPWVETTTTVGARWVRRAGAWVSVAISDRQVRRSGSWT